MFNKENQLLVSIIVPVYKVEKYIYQCIDSLLAQTYRNIEIILVDDGSPDRSGAICDEYAAVDSRVKVIHQTNGGVSVARQTGMDNATGDYFIHADPDDWVESTMIEELMAKAIEEDADMVICDYISENDYGQEYNCLDLPQRPAADDLLRRLLLQQLHGSCCNKLVRRACSNGVSFTPSHLCIYEDELFNIRILRNDIKVVYLPKAFYHYRMNNNDSLCHAYSTKSLNSAIDVENEKGKIIAEDERLHGIDTYESVKRVLLMAFMSKRFDILEQYHSERHKEIIKNGTPYKLLRPVSSNLALALKGFPRLAYYLYSFEMWLIVQLKKMRKRR